MFSKNIMNYLVLENGHDAVNIVRTNNVKQNMTIYYKYYKIPKASAKHIRHLLVI